MHYFLYQEMVDGGKSFPEVLKLYEKWHKKEVGNNDCLIITCGDWDLKTMLPMQCRLDKLQIPAHCHYWHNIKCVSHVKWMRID